jgi:hypothetical protein
MVAPSHGPQSPKMFVVDCVHLQRVAPGARRQKRATRRLGLHRNPYGQKTEPADPASRRLLMIIAQKPTQSLAAPHWPLTLPIRRLRKQQDISPPLMIPLGMEMVDIVAQRPPQRALAEEDHLAQAFLLPI